MNNRELKTIIKLFEESDLSRLKLQKDNVSVELEKQVQVQSVQHVQPVETKEAPVSVNKEDIKQTNEVSYEPIKAPLVGTFYEAPAPDQPPFVKPGQSVKKGDTLFIIEAMKVMNEITAPRDGKIMKISVDNGDMVMFDQTVMEIE